MDKFEIYRYWWNRPVIIEKNDNTRIYGGLVGINSEIINTATVFYVLENLSKHKYDETHDEGLFISVPCDEIKNIADQIKNEN